MLFALQREFCYSWTSSNSQGENLENDSFVVVFIFPSMLTELSERSEKKCQKQINPNRGPVPLVQDLVLDPAPGLSQNLGPDPGLFLDQENAGSGKCHCLLLMVLCFFSFYLRGALHKWEFSCGKLLLDSSLFYHLKLLPLSANQFYFYNLTIQIALARP